MAINKECNTFEEWCQLDNKQTVNSVINVDVSKYTKVHCMLNCTQFKQILGIANVMADKSFGDGDYITMADNCFWIEYDSSTIVEVITPIKLCPDDYEGGVLHYVCVDWDSLYLSVIPFEDGTDIYSTNDKSVGKYLKEYPVTISYHGNKADMRLGMCYWEEEIHTVEIRTSQIKSLLQLPSDSNFIPPHSFSIENDVLRIKSSTRVKYVKLSQSVDCMFEIPTDILCEKDGTIRYDMKKQVLSFVPYEI